MTDDELAQLKSRLRLSDQVRCRVKLKKQGGDWFGPCPFHEEKTASFSVNDAKGFYHCFGCGAHGDILDWWQSRDGLSFAEARERLRREAGSLPPAQESRLPVASPGRLDEEARRKQLEARAIWRASKPIEGSVAEAYLREARSIRLPELPECLRCHPGLQPSPREEGIFPAMVAAVTDGSGEVVAIQRTFLAADGSAKAKISASKRSLGPVGLGAVRLAPAAFLLGVGEGIETSLSAMEIFQVPVWAVLGSNLSRLDLPRSVRNVVVFGDCGSAGEAAAAKACQIYRSQGRKVAVRFPELGDDFNDELRAKRNGG